MDQNIDIDADYLSSLSGLAITDQITRLNKDLNAVSEELTQQVREKHGALLQQAAHAGRFDSALNALSDDVERIRATSQRLKTQIDDHYILIENQAKILSRLHEVSHLLRSSSAILNLCCKIKATKDPLKQANMYWELGSLIEDKDLNSIEFIQEERSYLKVNQQKLKNLTQMQLVAGLQERNKPQVVNALKVFLNFRTLEKSLQNLIKTYMFELDQSLKECFAGNDISVLNRNETSTSTSTLASSSSSSASASSTSKMATTIRGPGKAPQLSTTQNFRARFWKSLHWLLYEELYEYCDQVNFLRECLEQINQLGFVSYKEQAIQKQFWESVQSRLLQSFVGSPVHILQTLQDGLPKLLSSAKGLEDRLHRKYVFDHSVFTQLDTGYLNRCSGNMKACLAGVELPTNDTVDTFIRCAATEINAALISSRLSRPVVAMFNAYGTELCTKLESQIKFEGDAKQVVDVPNVHQIQNSSLANILYYYKDSVRRMIRDMRDRLADDQAQLASELTVSMERAGQLINSILRQIIDSICSTITIILLSMHREPGLNADKKSSVTPSMYMKELQDFVQRSWSNHIQAFHDKEAIERFGLELSQRCIDLFVHNLIVVRPLSQNGRNRLKNDCLFLEQALKPACPNIALLGNAARLVRALSLLIVQEAQQLAEQPVGKDSLVPSYMVIFLMFSHASADLQSPHTAANWSNERLIDWFQKHNTNYEKLELVSGALQRYRDNMRRKNCEQYDEVYPLVMEYFERAIKANGQ